VNTEPPELDERQDAASPAAARTGARNTSFILFRYIAGEFLIPLTCCLGGFIALFLITDVFDVLRDFLEAKAPVGQVLLFFFLRQPANLVNVLPMSILLSASFMINILGRHHEITALRASGLSLPRSCLPVWLAALAFSGLSLWLSESIAPECAARAEELLDRLTTPAHYFDQGRAKLAFRNGRDNRDWFFESFNREGQQRGVLLKQFRPDRKILWELRAARAQYREGHWVFFEGALTRFDAEGALPEGPEEQFAVREAPDLDESPGQILNSLRPAEELAIREMLRILRLTDDLPQSTADVLFTTLWYRLSFPFACLVAALLGVSLSATHESSNALRGFAMAVGIMVLYYIVGQLFVLLGKNGVVPPVCAGCLPTIAFAGWGGWEVFQKR